MQLISKIFGGLIGGVACFSAAFADDTPTLGSANVDQIPGNIAVIQQQNNRNTASVEQQTILGAAYANVAVIQRYGLGGSASVTQQGQQNAAGIAQYGNGEKATVTQNGITVIQSGTSAPGAPPITIKQF